VLVVGRPAYREQVGARGQPHDDRTSGLNMLELGTSDDIVLLACLGAAILLLVAGVRERRRHQRHLDAVDLRISVNGSRGKSTVTRLLTGALAAGGYHPLGKTTGTAAQLVFGWSSEQEPIPRRPEGPNIGEQRELMRRAVEHDADAVVAECMAVTPEYQLTFHRELLDVNLLVITNALADHLDEMGPTVRDVADVLAASIPTFGTVVISPGEHIDRFEEVARQRNAELLVADADEIEERQLAGFEHLVLPDHLAQVFAVTRHLGIHDEDALRGMKQAPPDPFATRLIEIGDPNDPALLVNAFPANDPTSTLAVWDHVRGLGYPETGLIVVMNCRDDRIARSQLFARDVLPHLPIDTLVITGSATRSITRGVEEGSIVADTVIDRTGSSADAVVGDIEDRLAGRVVLGVGNLHGGGAEIVARLEDRRVAHPLGQEAS
jgi:gamma-polyglutamate synthase